MTPSLRTRLAVNLTLALSSPSVFTSRTLRPAKKKESVKPRSSFFHALVSEFHSSPSGCVVRMRKSGCRCANAAYRARITRSTSLPPPAACSGPQHTPYVSPEPHTHSFSAAATRS